MMADKFIPFNKLSRKEQRRINSLSRRDWGGVCPLTRTVDKDMKKYSRTVKHKGRQFEYE